MTWHSLPIFVRLEGRPVILLGEGEAADAKRRLLTRAGAAVVGEEADARLAIVAIEEEAEAHAAVARLKARGMLVNAVDRPALCDFTLPAIVDRDPVLIAVGTGGVSAGLAAALRQRLETLLSPMLGWAAEYLQASRPALRAAFPDANDRRRAIARALGPGGPLDLADPDFPKPDWIEEARESSGWTVRRIELRSTDPDDLTLRQARMLAQADRVYHATDVPLAVLFRARADAPRIVGRAPNPPGPGYSVEVIM